MITFQCSNISISNISGNFDKTIEKSYEKVDVDKFITHLNEIEVDDITMSNDIDIAYNTLEKSITKALNKATIIKSKKKKDQKRQKLV